MKVALKQYLQQRLAIILLVFYFVFHGVVVNAGAVSILNGTGLLLVLWTCGLLLYELCLWVYKSHEKAIVASFLVIAGVMFFGVFQDAVAGWKPIAALGRVTMFFPLVIVVLSLGLVYLYKTGTKFTRLRKFLTYLLIIYVLIDVVKIVRTITFPANTIASQKETVAGRARPDVYLVLLDEYLGHEGLQSYFGYPNSSFKDFLRSEGFYQVKGPVSNYSLTVFSIASMLNMDFLQGIGEPVISNHYAYKTALEKIEKNRVCSIFSDMGYSLRNKTPFYLHGHAPAYNQNLLPQRLNLLQHQTMYYRVGAALPDFLGSAGNNYFIHRKRRRIGGNNDRMMQEVLDEAAAPRQRPHFTYMHLLMPHDPFLRDSLGRDTEIIKEGEWTQPMKDSAYLQYLVYTNNTITAFLRKLKTLTKDSAVILVMSDHGSRHVGSQKLQLGHNTINDVYVPGADISAWYDGLSNVNAFTVLFRELYGMHLPMRRDSIISHH